MAHETFRTVIFVPADPLLPIRILVIVALIAMIFTFLHVLRQLRNAIQERMMPQVQTAIVTGSSQGIGQAIAERLAKDGANVVIDYHRHDQGAEQTRNLVETAGGRALIVKADLSSVSAIDFLV